MDVSLLKVTNKFEYNFIPYHPHTILRKWLFVIFYFLQLYSKQYENFLLYVAQKGKYFCNDNSLNNTDNSIQTFLDIENEGNPSQCPFHKRLRLCYSHLYQANKYRYSAVPLQRDTFST